MPDRDADALRVDLLQRFTDAESTFDDDEFDSLALRVFARNFEDVPPYAAYCRARGRTPRSVESWLEIPAVPTAAFRDLRLAAPGRPAEAVFRTSGTSRGPERRGAHHVADLALYRASLRSTFRAFLLPDDASLRVLSLMPRSTALPDSSLAFMIDDVMDAFGAEGSEACADAEGVRIAALDQAVERAVQEDRPVLLLGTSAAFIHWLDALAERGTSYPLPGGSRLMDTGGYKGRGRRVSEASLRDWYQRRLGLPAAACVNEYGMTELLSQRYDNSLRARHDGVERPAGKEGPGWLRSVAVDPETLEPVAPGETGILRHVDLANLDSVAAIQTEDLGSVRDGVLTLEGRALGAPPRGCSLAMDLLMGGAP